MRKWLTDRFTREAYGSARAVPGNGTLSAQFPECTAYTAQGEGASCG